MRGKFVHVLLIWRDSYLLMSLRQYFKARDGLPDPKGSLSSNLSSRAIATANKEVEAALKARSKGKKRGPYQK